MNHTWLNIYYQMPPFIRSIAASMRGYYLRCWRYGPETERLVEEALEREYWDIEQWRTWQEERLAFVLNRAATQVPYYREQWAEKRRKGDRTSWEYLENWPILEKESLRKYPMAFLADDCNPGKMFIEHTSGSTGKPLQIWKSRNTLRTWYALAEARWRRWYGIKQNDRWAILGGQLVTSIKNVQPPFWVWNAALKQLYMSSYHLSKDLIKYYIDALRKYNIKYIYGYTSSLFALAIEALQINKTDFNISVVISNAEPIFDYQRATIEKAIKCTVRETYGMTEIVSAASECENAVLHLWPEVGYVEIMNGNKRVGPNKPGDLILTGLLNIDMPLIRYRLGDQGILDSPMKRCKCGRILPILKSIEGRNDDVLYTLNGRCIGRIGSTVFKENLPIREAQIIQVTFDTVKVRYVPTDEFTPNIYKMLKEKIQARMGKIKVTFEEVEQVPRYANGKFKTVVCDLPKEQIIDYGKI